MTGFGQLSEALEDVYLEKQLAEDEALLERRVQNVDGNRNRMLRDIIEPAIKAVYKEMFLDSVGNVAGNNPNLAGYFESVRGTGINQYYYKEPEHGEIEGRRQRSQFRVSTPHRLSRRSTIINAVLGHIGQHLNKEDMIILPLGEVPKGNNQYTKIDPRTRHSVGPVRMPGVENSMKHVIWAWPPASGANAQDFQNLGDDDWFRVAQIKINNIGSVENHIELTYGIKAARWRNPLR